MFYTFSVYRRLCFNRSDAAALMNLCLALILLEVLFAVGIHRVNNYLLCMSVSVTLHYFILSSMLWLGCGGVALIKLLLNKESWMEVHDPVFKYYLVGWGECTL